MILSPQEQYIVEEILRKMRPFEKLEIHADPNGKPDTFRIVRSQTVLVSQMLNLSKTVDKLMR